MFPFQPPIFTPDTSFSSPILMGLMYNSPFPSSRMITSSIEGGGKWRSHTNFGDDVTATSWDTACQS